MQSLKNETIMLNRFTKHHNYMKQLFVTLMVMALSFSCTTKGPNTTKDSSRASDLPSYAKVDLSQLQLPAAKARTHVSPEVSNSVRSDYKSALKSLNSGIKDNDFDDAIEKLERLETENPELSGPSTNLGIIHMHLKEYEEAEKAFKRALVINNENEYAYNNLGLAYRELGRFTEARDNYLEAAALNPQYAEAHYNLGVLSELYLNDLELALRSFQYYTLASKSPDDKVNTWMVDLDNRIKQNNKIKEAEAEAESLAQQEQNSTEESQLEAEQAQTGEPEIEVESDTTNTTSATQE